MKVRNFLRCVVCFQYFKFYFDVYMLTSEMEVIKCCHLFTKYSSSA